ncbi:HlyD family efflux transporter periplasmic adaptor subunit [Sphingorhabdus sp. IMCC26285]|uniref:HlyD family efflux transporter periplasmic adaptor subunit n=1 Tax=Sphingorhabdus profundilacus TaxID=2509718 RepID=A0A6I4M2D6_9SPHN|nr:HlyD family efflux transporter periplasmic adaptor subunit [Sphingorhabdus profundilacus]MVZ96475.1 HlyD family efflux transporter periplasmic adaptor subunit [Sphingorhabdus profundilacus]
MFRPEALSYRADRLSGDVALAVPLAWQSIGYLIFAGVVAAVIFLSFAGYARVEVATGSIVPDKGVSAIQPTRNGVVAALWVKDGQNVPAGAELATIRSEEEGAANMSPAAQIEAAVGHQDASLVSQIAASSASANAQLRQLAAQRIGLIGEIGQLQSQIALQRSLIVSAQKDYDRVRVVAERGFISLRDLQAREETLLGRQQGLSQLTQSLAVKQAALTEADRSGAQIIAQAQAQNAGLSAARAEVAQQAANAAGSRAYVLRAPVAGRVTALTARVGQSVNPQSPVMTIVPAGSVLQAELAIPGTAIGFIRPGQVVRLAIDAFPFQRFGTIKGRIRTVASSAVSARTGDGGTIAVYPVIITLDQSYLMAFGRRQPLVPGMSLTARIVTEKQSLLTWLFEPLFAVRNR